MKFSMLKIIGNLLGVFVLIGWGAGTANPSGIFKAIKRQAGASMRDINEVMNAHAGDLMALPGVVGVYVSALDDGTPCIKVMVVKARPELQKKIPKNLAGYPVLIVETGEINPLSEKLT